MAGTGIMTVPVLETPFLTHLNLSHNAISVLNEEILNKPSLLSLDVSFNEIPNLSFGLTSAWPKLRNLKYLDISANPVTFIIKGDFKYLDGLETLKLSKLDKCTKIETGSFSNLKNLRVFEMFGLPKVVFMDVRGNHSFRWFQFKVAQGPIVQFVLLYLMRPQIRHIVILLGFIPG